MKLLVQPGDGITLLLKGIHSAKRTVEIVIFRFNLPELETALKNAAKRGVRVQALIAYTNHGGERNLRKLEMRLLSDGVTVARTLQSAGELPRTVLLTVQLHEDQLIEALHLGDDVASHQNL